MQAQDHIEALLIIAHSKGYYQRFPQRGNYPAATRKESICYHLQALDKQGIAGAIQNEALMFINEVSEGNRVWELFYQHSKQTIAGSLMQGVSFNHWLNA